MIKRTAMALTSMAVILFAFAADMPAIAEGPASEIHGSSGSLCASCTDQRRWLIF